MIVEKQRAIGNQWAKINAYLPGNDDRLNAGMGKCPLPDFPQRK
jgi:hypothetical protein